MQATVGFCNNGVCADPNTTCCAYALEFQTALGCAGDGG